MPLTMQTLLISQSDRHRYRGPARVVTLPIQLPIQQLRLAPFGRANPIGLPHIEVLDQVYASNMLGSRTRILAYSRYLQLR